MTRTPRSRERPRKQPIQRRSRVTVDAILGATARILIESGHASLTTNRVAAKAGVSIGTLYEWFPSKEALVSAIVERHLARAEEVLVRLATDLAPIARRLTPRDLGARLAEAMVTLHEDEPRLHRVLTEEIPHTASTRARVRGLEERMTSALAALIAAHPSARVRDATLAARLVVTVLEAATHRWATDGGGRLVARDALVDELALLVGAYLRAAPAASQARARKSRTPRSSPIAALHLASEV